VNENEKTIIEIIMCVWKKLDFKEMHRSRILGIYGELQGKINYALCADTLKEFFSRLSKKLNIRDAYCDPELFQNKNDKEIIQYVKKNLNYIMLLFRNEIEIKKEERKNAV